MFTVLCPPCQVRQKRFSGRIWYKMADWDMANLPPDYDSDSCDVGFVEECNCDTCKHQRRREKVMQSFREEEALMNAHMEDLARLYSSE